MKLALRLGIRTDFCLFLAGLAIAGDIARRAAIFVWILKHAAKAAKGSQARLFLLVYCLSVGVTVLFSNYVTAVALIPAVHFELRRMRAAPFPHLLGCVLAAIASGFVLPISNPLNALFWGRGKLDTPEWLRLFAVPSLFSISLIYMVLRLMARRALVFPVEVETQAPALHLSDLFQVSAFVGFATAMLCAYALTNVPGFWTLVASIALLGSVLIPKLGR